MPKHIVRLILLMVVFGAIAIAGKIYFVPSSFFEYGHYRAKAVTEIASDIPMFRGPSYCKSCHIQQFTEWSASTHHINCENCHGAAGRHPLVGMPPLPKDNNTHQQIMYSRYRLTTGKMRVPTNTVQLCAQCHEAIPGRPSAQPQIVVRQHAGTQQCVVCHSAHAPKIIFPSPPKDALSGLFSTGKASSSQCAACHGANGMALTPQFPNLAGQQRAYLVAALEAYKSGTRKAPIMNGVTANLDNADMANLAAYFSGLSWKTPASAGPDPIADTRLAHSEACSNCHGVQGISRNPVIPNLAGQNEAYLAGALDAYRNGTRHEALMDRVAAHLSATDIKHLAAYYAGLPCASKPYDAAGSSACKSGTSHGQ